MDELIRLLYFSLKKKNWIILQRKFKLFNLKIEKGALINNDELRFTTYIIILVRSIIWI
jgi:hypothetical protein